MNENIVFFFGAGAECGEKSFGLPSGGDYTLKTMQQKHTKLYTALKSFYEPRLSVDYVKEYRNSFLFEKDSHTFREIIYRAAKECIPYRDANPRLKPFLDFIDLVNRYEGLNEAEEEGKKAAKELSEEIKTAGKTVYDLLIRDSDSSKKGESFSPVADTNTENAKDFKDYLLFYGAVEKDFSAIADPSRFGLTQFWRVINYYWSAFFTIVEPICIDFSWYGLANGEKKQLYDYTLNHLSNVIDEIYSCFDYKRVDDLKGNYYRAIADKFPNSTAITTNYTPFVEHYFENKSIYLAGRLSEFEFPEKLSVIDIRRKSIDGNSFVFPFLMTQAPIKPIIVPNQIREYNRALERLQEATDIIIIGYGLGQADNHINAILREFTLDSKKTVIYCHYSANELDSNELEREKKQILQNLKISEDLPNLHLVSNHGDAEELLNNITELLNRKGEYHV